MKRLWDVRDVPSKIGQANVPDDSVGVQQAFSDRHLFTIVRRSGERSFYGNGNVAHSKARWGGFHSPTMEVVLIASAPVLHQRTLSLNEHSPMSSCRTGTIIYDETENRVIVAAVVRPFIIGESNPVEAVLEVPMKCKIIGVSAEQRGYSGALFRAVGENRVVLMIEKNEEHIGILRAPDPVIAFRNAVRCLDPCDAAIVCLRAVITRVNLPSLERTTDQMIDLFIDELYRPRPPSFPSPDEAVFSPGCRAALLLVAEEIHSTQWKIGTNESLDGSIGQLEVLWNALNRILAREDSPRTHRSKHKKKPTGTVGPTSRHAELRQNDNGGQSHR